MTARESATCADRLGPVDGTRPIGHIEPLDQPPGLPMDTPDIEDMFAALGPISIKRMFGGKGIYHRGLIIAIELRGEILLKADAVSAPDFAAAGATRWSYEGKAGKSVNMPYWSVPDEAFDDPEVMARWVRLAYRTALRVSAA